MTDTTTTEVTTGSRAVLRRVEPGNMALCVVCGDQVKFAARQNRQQVIANVYRDQRWDRVEHFHDECYAVAGEPYGPAGLPVLNANRR
jgi:hypothetical protein